ncbi:LacI family DNA-binding transcriptional regulator [Roseibium sp.]|uniref:LacI family DNA-binding transcriptional regulator n=1 Tax=Roseibium sp. TaxID=1936156 RepID=UPI003D0AD82C
MATIKDIAKRVGVSPTTVSRVLSADPKLSVTKEVRKKVIETAAELNYSTPRDKRLARSSGEMAASPLRNVLVLQGLSDDQELADPYYVGVRVGVEKTCQAMGLSTAVHYSDDPASEISIDPATGIVLMGHHSEEALSAILAETDLIAFAGEDLPYYDYADRDTVKHDLVGSMSALLSNLVDAGYRDIGFIGFKRNRPDTSPTVAHQMEARAAAFVDWLSKRELFDETLMRREGKTSQNGYDLTLDLLRGKKLPDVIVAATDSLAIGAYMALKENGKSIPEDIAVVAFNDIPAAQFLVPPLTTVKLSAELIGKTAVELLAERCGGRDVSKKITLGAKIIWRDSARKPPQNS